MPKMLQCDVEAIKKLIASLEADPASETTIEIVQVRLKIRTRIAVMQVTS
jgi:hypothetical protein